MSIADLAEEWATTKLQLNKLKKQELNLRKQLTTRILETGQSSSRTIHLGGMKLKATAPLNYSVRADDLTELFPDLTEAEMNAVSVKYTVKPGTYAALPTDALLRTIVTVKPGLEQLVIL